MPFSEQLEEITCGLIITVHFLVWDASHELCVRRLQSGRPWRSWRLSPAEAPTAACCLAGGLKEQLRAVPQPWKASTARFICPRVHQTQSRLEVQGAVRNFPAGHPWHMQPAATGAGWRVDSDAAWTWHSSLSRLRMNDVFKHSNSESLAGLHRLQERMEQTRRSDTWLAALVRVVARTGIAITAAVGIPVVVGAKWWLARSGCFSRRRDGPCV